MCRMCGESHVVDIMIIDKDSTRTFCPNTYHYQCNLCGYEEHDNFTKHYKFCPNCGVRVNNA